MDTADQHECNPHSSFFMIQSKPGLQLSNVCASVDLFPVPRGSLGVGTERANVIYRQTSRFHRQIGRSVRPGHMAYVTIMRDISIDVTWRLRVLRSGWWGGGRSGKRRREVDEFRSANIRCANDLFGTNDQQWRTISDLIALVGIVNTRGNDFFFRPSSSEWLWGWYSLMLANLQFRNTFAI